MLDDRVLGNDRRQSEVRFHNKVTAFMPNPAIVRGHQAVYDNETGVLYLIFDDVTDTHFQLDYFPNPSFDQVKKVIDPFTEIHSFLWDQESLGENFLLPEQETVTELINSTREVSARFTDIIGDRLSPSQRLIFEKVLTILPKLEELINRSGNLTLIHGDPN